ncbi:uncharacterized protein METZ01_LOCUS465897, partial [marine metagenome]
HENWAENWKPEMAKKITNAAITNCDATFDAILASNDGTAGGAIQALLEEGLDGKIAVTGQDADLVACQCIAARTQAMSIYKPIKNLANRVAEIAVAMAHGTPIIVRKGVHNNQVEVHGLCGENGAGKSTTLKAISGMVKLAAGSIHYNGELIVGRTPNQMVQRGVAQVPEGRRIFKDLKVSENLRMGADIRKDKAGIESDLEMVFDLFPTLKERTSQLGGSLSGGEQQMLAIGRGLMAKPELLLLDEPS